MAQRLYGALTVGERKTVDACSTVESKVVDGVRVVMLAAVQGELATPTLEIVKGAFAKLVRVDDGAAQKLASPGLPPQFASGVGVVLLVGDRAFAGASGGARCYLERGEKLEAATGGFDVNPGDSVIAASHGDLATGTSFLPAVEMAASDDTFRNDGLDDALGRALAGHAGLLSAAVARI